MDQRQANCSPLKEAKPKQQATTAPFFSTLRSHLRESACTPSAYDWADPPAPFQGSKLCDRPASPPNRTPDPEGECCSTLSQGDPCRIYDTFVSIERNRAKANQGRRAFWEKNGHLGGSILAQPPVCKGSFMLIHLAKQQPSSILLGVIARCLRYQRD